jgi:acyl-CoA synthetase (AMP-forming)/AMP-acid ligase II/thioesterase domain-containing protein/acyl carrier protein
LASHLVSIGVQRADPVALLLDNGPSNASTLLGVMAAATAAPLNPQYTADELRFFLEDLRPAAFIVDSTIDTPALDVAATLGVRVLALTPATSGVAGDYELDGGVRSNGTSLPVAPQRDDVALLLHTSGTTNRPKLVPLTHANLTASAGNVARALELRPADRSFNVMPLFHIHGIVASLLASLVSGGSVVCTPGFRSTEVVDWMADLEPTWYTAVPTLHRVLADVVADGTWRPALRFVRSSSAPLPTALAARLTEIFGAPVIEAYGMTEAAHQIASNTLDGTRKPGSVGPSGGPEIAIFDPGANAVAAGEAGEIVIRGPNVTAGYVDNADANAAAFVDGWLRTGDQGVLDEDGHLTITGRLKEIINRGGEKVAPTEVENALLAHPDVAEAAVFSIPHPRLGEDVAAAVVLRPDSVCSEGGLRRFVGEHVAPFKVPRQITFVDEIPKGPTGKVQRVSLAQQLDAGVVSRAIPGDIVEPRNDTERELVRMFADVLELDAPVGITDDFIQLGADSLHFVELVNEIERVFHRAIPPALFLTGATPERIAEFLRGDADELPLLLPIQPDGSRPPLFCVMRAGTLVAARHFVPELGPDQPILGIWMPGMHGAPDAAGGIEEIAAACRGAIAARCESGPYFLFGYSMGGLVAYEMARQYAAAGESVGVVLMADTWLPQPLPTFRDQLRKLFSREGPAAALRRIGRMVGWRRRPTKEAMERAERAHARAAQLGPGVDLHAALLRERRYAGKDHPPAAPVVMLTSRHTIEHVSGGSTTLGWERYVRDDWQFIDVPGDHDTMLGEPHIHVLAAAVARSLVEAQDRAAG